jgi:hypothetical protein
MELIYNDEQPQLINMPHTYYVRTNSYLFHKENLWNLLEQKVPEKYTNLVFLDGDILFKNLSWHAEISLLLGSGGMSVIQPFETVDILDAEFNIEKSGISFMKAIDTRKDTLGTGYFSYPFKGLGIACRRSWLRSVGGFFEWFIMGGGDHAMMDSITNSNIIKNHICYELQPYAQSEYDQYKNNMTLKGPYTYGYAKLRIQHLFHGVSSDRQYNTRHEHTKHLQQEDFIKNAEGIIELKNPHKYNPLILEYFRNRKDDSVTTN